MAKMKNHIERRDVLECLYENVLVHRMVAKGFIKCFPFSHLRRWVALGKRQESLFGEQGGLAIELLPHVV